MSGPFRKTDAVFTITQDNSRQSIEVTDANPVACTLVGYEREELLGSAFAKLLPERIAEMLDDYVEFEDAANDVGDVLGKVRDFQLQPKKGKPKTLSVKVVRHTSAEHAEYLLIFHNEAQKQKIDSIMRAVKKLLEGKRAIDTDTGLAMRNNFEQAVNVLLPQLDDIENGVTMAVFELDDYASILAKRGIGIAQKLMQEAGAMCKRNLRSNDVVAQFDDRRIVVILAGASGEPAKIVLNRLRWRMDGVQVEDDEKHSIRSNATVWTRTLDIADKAETVFADFEQAFSAKTDAQSNTVIEI